jgi:hypothetical protein
MIWAALTIIVMQGVLAVIGLVVIRSFGAFTSDLRSWTGALIRTHDANVRIHEHNDHLVEELSRTARQLRRVSDQLHGSQSTLPPDQEKSA